MITQILLPGSIIGTIFFIIWIVIYPTELWEALIFKHRHTFEDISLNIITWIFLSSFIFTAITLAKLIDV